MTFGTRAGTGFSLKASLYQWARGWLSGKPHFTIGANYMHRRYVLPRNPWLNIYLHKFLHDDEDRALHDHPWWFVSVMLVSGYSEIVKHGQVDRHAPSVAFRSATHAHRVVLKRSAQGEPMPCWTLVMTGRVVRDWGFHCPQGWRHFKEFTSPGNYGQTGKGCD